MEKALRYELNTITELTNSIYPTNAPEGVTKPYLVYARITTRTIKTLDGYTSKQALSFMLSIMAQRYGDMASIRNKVEQVLLSLLNRKIGNDGSIFVEDLKINNITEAWEPELKLNRGIIDFTIYF